MSKNTDKKTEKKEITVITEAKEETGKAGGKKKKRFRLKNPRMFMFWMDVLVLFLLAFGLYIGIRYMMNRKFVKAYEGGDYQTEQEESLKKLNLVERYLPYYNLGNVAYKEGDYSRAIGYYKQALDMDPPKYKECPIRINLALAMIKKIDFNDLSTEKKVQNAIQQLRAARTVLTAHQCAGPVEDDGHSEEAEQLKKDIDDMIEKLENPPDQDQQDGDDQDNQDQNQDQNKDQDQNQDQDQNKETEQEKKIREQLEEQQKEALQERAEEQQKQQSQWDASGDQQQGGGGGQNSNGKNW